MPKDSNTSQMLITSTSENTTRPRSGRLQFYQDNLSFPQLYLSAYVAGPPADTWGFSAWLGRAGCTEADSPENADFVVFTGGPDVSPSLYNEPRLSCTHEDHERDEADAALYDKCLSEGIPMVGICRGAQFLWVMQGGKLYQDIAGHNSGEHEILHLPTNTKYIASSVHHQAVIPSGVSGLRLIATAAVSDRRETAQCVSTGTVSDFEIYGITPRAILGIQGHPEYPGFPNYSKLCAELIEEHITNNNNTKYVNGVLRLRD